MNGPPSLRPYRPNDRAAVERLLRRGLKEQVEHAAACVPPEDEGFFESEMAEHLAGLESEPGNWWVAEADDGGIIGCMWLRALKDALGPYRSVRQIIVAPDHRGHGLGGRLLGLAESIARASDAVMLLISGLQPNPALRLYRRLGFEDFPDAYREDTNPNLVVLWKDFGVAGEPDASEE